jgi:hypothetical protein
MRWTNQGRFGAKRKVDPRGLPGAGVALGWKEDGSVSVCNPIFVSALEHHVASGMWLWLCALTHKTRSNAIVIAWCQHFRSRACLVWEVDWLPRSDM